MKFNRNTILVVISLVAILFLIKRVAISYYQPRSIEIEPVNEGSLFDLEYKLECAPGHTKEGSIYTKALTPGGLCKSEQFVRDQANYAIIGGIGGSLI